MGLRQWGWMLVRGGGHRKRIGNIRWVEGMIR